MCLSKYQLSAFLKSKLGTLFASEVRVDPVQEVNSLQSIIPGSNTVRVLQVTIVYSDRLLSNWTHGSRYPEFITTQIII